MRSSRSYTVTMCPARVSCWAHARPAGPEPITATALPGMRPARRGVIKPHSHARPAMATSTFLIVTAGSLMASTQAGSHGAGQSLPVKLGKAVGGVQPLAPGRPVAAPDQIIPFRDKVPKRAAVVAEGDAAVHATPGLRADDRQQAPPVVDLVPVLHALPDTAAGAVLAGGFEEALRVSHGALQRRAGSRPDDGSFLHHTRWQTLCTGYPLAFGCRCQPHRHEADTRISAEPGSRSAVPGHARAQHRSRRYARSRRPGRPSGQPRQIGDKALGEPAFRSRSATAAGSAAIARDPPFGAAVRLVGRGRLAAPNGCSGCVLTHRQRESRSHRIGRRKGSAALPVTFRGSRRRVPGLGSGSGCAGVAHLVGQRLGVDRLEWVDQRWSGLTSGAGRMTWSCCGVASAYGRAGWRATAVISTFASPRRAAPTVVRTGRGSGKCRSYTVLKRWKSDRSARWTRQETTFAGAQPAAPSSAATLPSALSAWSSIVSPVARGRSGRPATPTRRPQDLASTARPAGPLGM